MYRSRIKSSVDLDQTTPSEVVLTTKSKSTKTNSADPDLHSGLDLKSVQKCRSFSDLVCV